MISPAILKKSLQALQERKISLQAEQEKLRSDECSHAIAHELFKTTQKAFELFCLRAQDNIYTMKNNGGLAINIERLADNSFTLSAEQTKQEVTPGQLDPGAFISPPDPDAQRLEIRFVEQEGGVTVMEEAYVPKDNTPVQRTVEQELAMKRRMVVGIQNALV